VRPVFTVESVLEVNPGLADEVISNCVVIKDLRSEDALHWEGRLEVEGSGCREQAIALLFNIRKIFFMACKSEQTS